MSDTKPETTAGVHDEVQSASVAEAETPPTIATGAVDDAFAQALEALPPDSPTEEIARLQAELAAANERTLRAHAELDNFRKRIYRQMDDERKYAALPLLRDLLPVVDNLERALASAKPENGSSALAEGVKLVVHQLQTALGRHHCQRIEAEGQTFDPHLHEAIAQHPSDTHPAGAVVAVAQVGYRLHDRVVRPAQVLVSAGPASAPATTE